MSDDEKKLEQMADDLDVSKAEYFRAQAELQREQVEYIRANDERCVEESLRTIEQHKVYMRENSPEAKRESRVFMAAMAAMQAMLTGKSRHDVNLMNDYGEDEARRIAKAAFVAADALMAECERRKP